MTDNTSDNILQEPPVDPQDTPPRGTSAQSDHAHITPAKGIPVVRMGDTPPSGIRRTDIMKALEAQQAQQAQQAAQTGTDEHEQYNEPPQRGSSVLGWISTIAAVIVTGIAGFIYISDSTAPTPVVPTAESTRIVIQASPIPPTVPPTIQPTQEVRAADQLTEQLSTEVPPDIVAELLLRPGEVVAPQNVIYRSQTAYTIAPVSARSRVIDYVVKPGDTLEKIAQRFGITLETIVGNNDVTFVNRLDAGQVLKILPVDGLLYRTESDATIQQVADKLQVNPYSIIDSEYNNLTNLTPEVQLPAGFEVLVPGAKFEVRLVYWDPGIQTRSAAPVAPGGGNAQASGNAQGEIAFPAGPGSCGYVPNTGGSGGLARPISNYVPMRGFGGGHGGIDLSAPSGTAVFAADAGHVVFAGWSTWGYGNTVVIAHGSMMTLYGHLSSINVGCGQAVGQSTLIGGVGSTGNSSGPHLHFEVRPGPSYQPVNPTAYVGF